MGAQSLLMDRASLPHPEHQRRNRKPHGLQHPNATAAKNKGQFTASCTVA